MTDERIAEIKALCEAATPGIWRCSVKDEHGHYIIFSDKTTAPLALIQWNAADAKLMAATRQIIPELLEELEDKERLLANAAAAYLNQQLAYDNEISDLKREFEMRIRRFRFFKRL